MRRWVAWCAVALLAILAVAEVSRGLVYGWVESTINSIRHHGDSDQLGTRVLVFLAHNLLRVVSTYIGACVVAWAALGLRHWRLQLVLLPIYAGGFLLVKSLTSIWWLYWALCFAAIGAVDVGVAGGKRYTAVRASSTDDTSLDIEDQQSTRRTALCSWWQATLARLSISLAALVFYAWWNATHLEPMSYFLRTLPEGFVPEPLCTNRATQDFATSVWPAYVRLHKRMLSPDTPDSERRFLVFRTSNDGLGNRLQALLSTLLLAMLTGRALVVDWRYSAQESAASFEDLLEDPPGLNWRMQGVRQSTQNIAFAVESHRWIPYCRSCAIRLRRQPVWEALLCSGDAGFASDARAHSVVSTQWYAPALAHNPHFRGAVCAWLGHEGIDALFPHLWRAAIRPNADVRARVQRTLDRYDAFAHTVGMQLRYREGNAIIKDMLEAYVRCARKLAYSGSPQPHIFVATDDGRLRKRLASMIPELVWQVQDDSRRSTVSGIQSALADMVLLGHCREVVISPYSTLGYVGAAISGRTFPHVVTRPSSLGPDGVSSGRCMRSVSRAPCMQYWFGVMGMGAHCWDTRTMLTTDMINQEDCYHG